MLSDAISQLQGSRFDPTLNCPYAKLSLDGGISECVVLSDGLVSYPG